MKHSIFMQYLTHLRPVLNLVDTYCVSDEECHDGKPVYFRETLEALLQTGNDHTVMGQNLTDSEASQVVRATKGAILLNWTVTDVERHGEAYYEAFLR